MQLPIELKSIILKYTLDLLDHDSEIERKARESFSKIIIQIKRIRMRPLYEFWWFSAHVSQRVFVVEQFGRGLWGLCRTPCFHWLLDDIV